MWVREVIDTLSDSNAYVKNRELQLEPFVYTCIRIGDTSERWIDAITLVIFLFIRGCSLRFQF